MNRVAPPRWLECVLLVLLPSRDRETVAGDLREEFCEQKAPKLGALRANLWYAREVLSFAPRRLIGLFQQRRALTLLCIFTGTAGSWLGGVDLYLRHPGYADREVISGIIVGQALLTLLALSIRSVALLKSLAMMGCAGIVWLACRALIAMVRGSHLEGYVLLIAMALLVQALLTLSTLPGAGDEPELVS